MMEDTAPGRAPGVSVSSSSSVAPDSMHISASQSPVTDGYRTPTGDESITSPGGQERHGFVALHIGAGYHAPSNEARYRGICAKACRKGMRALKAGESAVNILTCIIAALEDSPHTNAGLGSNLTMDGSVECDASIMEGASLHFGAVGAITGVKNPIKVARELLVKQKEGSMSLGRIPPCLMVGEGAQKWAQGQGLATIDNVDLITESTLNNHKKYKRRLERVEDSQPEKRARVSLSAPVTECSAANQRLEMDDDSMIQPDTSTDPPADAQCVTSQQLLDTVGAVCVDSHGNVAAAVSSGGIILKQPGRVGQASSYGCGCWAEQADGHASVAVSTTGSGEHLLKTLFAKTCADCIQQGEDAIQDTRNAFQNKFLKSRYLQQFKEKFGGALILKHEPQDPFKVEVVWAHSTDTMCVAYMSSADTVPCARVSRLPAMSNIKAGHSILVEGKLCTI